MLYIYLDESGDLGFKEKSSKHFVITLLIVENKKPIENYIKRIRQRKLKKLYRKHSEIKFTKSDELIRKKILKSLARKDIEISSLILKKEQVYGYLRDHRNEIYTYLSGIIIDKIIRRPRDRKIKIIVDKSLPKIKRKEFNEYVKNKIQSSLVHKIDIEIKHEDSNKEKCLQAVDFISGAIYNKYELDNENYYEIIKKKISKETILWR